MSSIILTGDIQKQSSEEKGKNSLIRKYTCKYKVCTEEPVGPKVTAKQESKCSGAPEGALARKGRHRCCPFSIKLSRLFA